MLKYGSGDCYTLSESSKAQYIIEGRSARAGRAHPSRIIRKQLTLTVIVSD
jgi:hypothetical protein